MKKHWQRLQNTLRQPKWRHGRWSVLMLAGFIAVCVLVNIGVEALEQEYGWRRDLSFNGYATTGEETKAVVDRLTQPVTLYLLYQGGEMDERLLELLNRYRILSDLITVAPTDIAKNPGILDRFQGDMDTALEADTVVVNCEATGRYKVLGYQDFIAQGYNIESGAFEAEGLAYQKQLTEALVYVTEATVPVIGILQGHGELSLTQLENLTHFWKRNHYDSKAVVLLTEEGLRDIDMLLIADPQKDLSDKEMAAVSAFAQQGGSLFVIRDYTDPLVLPNYQALLRNYGVVPLPGVVVAGEEDAGSYYGERIYLLPYLAEMDMTVPLIAGEMDVLLLAGACAFETPAPGDPSLSTVTVLKTGKNAYLRDPSDGNTTLDRQPGDVTGELSLALYAQRMHPTGDVSRLFAIGNSTLFTDEYVYQRTFNEEFIMQVMGQLLPQKTISLDIMVPSAFHPGLRAGGQSLGLGLIVALPLMALVAALCVLLPRRNR